MPDPPTWMESLVDCISDCIEADTPMGPLGYRYSVEEGFAEIAVYPTPVELVGGAEDGEVVLPVFSLDLKQFLSVFSVITHVHLRTGGLTPYEEEGIHVSIEGEYEDHEVWLRILMDPPEDEEVGATFDVLGSRPKP